MMCWNYEENVMCSRLGWMYSLAGGSHANNTIIMIPLPAIPMTHFAILYTGTTEGMMPNGGSFILCANELYSIYARDEQFDFFRKTITTILDEHMPLKANKKNAHHADKSWITTQELIGQRQRAFTNGNVGLYLHNKINRLSNRLSNRPNIIW